MIKEIGSEFWQEDINENYRNNLFEDNNRTKFLLSGRTAIDYVIKEIKNMGYEFKSLDEFIR